MQEQGIKDATKDLQLKNKLLYDAIIQQLFLEGGCCFNHFVSYLGH